MAQGVCSAHVISLHLTFSILMFHPPSLQFPHGHFDTSFPSAPSLPNKERVKRTSARAARSLATWPIPRTPQVTSPKSSTLLLLQMETRRLSTIRTTIISLTSRKSHAKTLDCSVFPQCWKPLFRTFLIVSFFFREKAKTACLGKPLQDMGKGKRGKKEKVL